MFVDSLIRIMITESTLNHWHARCVACANVFNLFNQLRPQQPTQRSFRVVDMLHASGLSRQDTLPAKDPLWSYQPAPGPGQPAPIPRRNEPLLFIPNHTAHGDTLKNLSQDHLLPGEGNPRIETLKAYSTNPGHHSNKHAVLNFYHVCSPLI
jgi:hypothetical protein